MADPLPEKVREADAKLRREQARAGPSQGVAEGIHAREEDRHGLQREADEAEDRV